MDRITHDGHLRRASTTPLVEERAWSANPNVNTDDRSPLLSRASSRPNFGGSPTTPRRIDQTTFPNDSPIRSAHLRNHHRIKSLRRALTTALIDHPTSYSRHAVTPAEALREPDGESAYDQFTSIDWVRDNIAAAFRAKTLGNRGGTLGQLEVWWDDAQGWVLAATVGILVAIMAFLVDITEASLFDLKLGYCKTMPLARAQTCCSGADTCDDWVLWTSRFTDNASKGLLYGCLIYIAFMVAMSLLACIIVLMSKRVAPSKLAKTKTEQDSMPEGADAYEEAKSSTQGMVLYPVYGSGVAEVKVIASGFVIHGFLGVKTLVLKAVGVTLSVASGLSVGKEGPFVHISAAIGNVISRLSIKYRDNHSKRREMISAASAAGVAVAFGAPISGVLFSLEEVSYYFPAKTLFRTFFCSIVAAVTLRVLDPYNTSKIVLFQVSYHSDWHALELIMFVMLGILGGLLGALFVKSTRLWARSFRKLPLIRSSPMFEVAIVALITGAVSFWNPYTKLSPAGLMLELASDCHRRSETGTGLCPTASEIPELLWVLAIAFIVKSFLTAIAFGIKVPAGIYVPSMCVGGLLGRFAGHGVQYLLVTYTDLDCSANGMLESCIVPGVYALLTAGAVMVGVTRLSITIAVMLFELSGSINHVLPFSIAVMFAKWTADAIEPLSIYDLLMETNQYPFLDSKTRPALTGELADIVPHSHPEENLDITQGPVISSSILAEKLKTKIDSGRTDAGFPVIREGVLLGIISCPDLAFCLDGIDETQDVPCLVSPRVKYQDHEDEELDDPTDFTPFIDPAPLCLDIHSSTEMVYECFVKLGVRYIPATRDGFYVGLIHKKEFLKWVRHLKSRS